jgi:hypothetical protein
MPELRINPDKVCEFIEAGRELAGRVPSTAGDRTTTGDDSPLTFMVQREDDPTRQLMAEFVGGLNIEEQEDLLALLYLGRGDFDLDSWDEAVAEARTRIDARDADFMIGDPGLPEYLGAALDAFGKTCPDI